MITKLKQLWKRFLQRKSLKLIRDYREFLEGVNLPREAKDTAIADTYVGEKIVLEGRLSYTEVRGAIITSKILILAIEALNTMEEKNTSHLQVVEQEEE